MHFAVSIRTAPVVASRRYARAGQPFAQAGTSQWLHASERCSVGSAGCRSGLNVTTWRQPVSRPAPFSLPQATRQASQPVHRSGAKTNAGLTRAARRRQKSRMALSHARLSGSASRARAYSFSASARRPR